MIERNVPDERPDTTSVRARNLLKGQKYGFRYDPMQFVEQDEGIQAARDDGNKRICMIEKTNAE